MRKRQEMRSYQVDVSARAFANPKLLLALDMGLGKTVISLTVVSDLLDLGEVRKVLVVGPKRVAKFTWPNEIGEWGHLAHLKHSVLIGTPAQRTKAVQSDAEIHIINRENFSWLCEHFGGALPYDMVIWDESSSLKEGKRKTGKGLLSRFGWLARVSPRLRRVMLLSGTPAPEGIEGLWGQMYVLDQGKRLGMSKTSFYNQYFNPKQRYAAGGSRAFTEYTLRVGSYERIMSTVEDVMIGIKSEDVLKLPPRIDHEILVDLPAAASQAYRKLKREYLLEAGSGIVAKSAGVLVNKLAQLASGAVYDEDRTVHHFHDAKIEALQELAENGERMLVFYNYQHDLARLKAAFPKAVVFADDPKALDRWNAKEIPMLLVHPASAGHGLNFQAGGRVAVWFSLPWSFELYEQANKRLHRSGQTGDNVAIYHILAHKTVDEQILMALRAKAADAGAIVRWICDRFAAEDL